MLGVTEVEEDESGEPSERQIFKSQIVISRWGGKRSLTSAFTEHGVTMLEVILTFCKFFGNG